LRARRAIVAAKRFLQPAIEKRGVPQKITLNGDAASHTAVAEWQEVEGLPQDFRVRTNRYVNNLLYRTTVVYNSE
jgi:transposase-like protein